MVNPRVNKSGDTIIRVNGLWKRYGLSLPDIIVRGLNRLTSISSLKGGREKNGGLEKDGGQWALRDVSFEIKRGDTIGILGRNGAGKSTLLKIIAGVTPSTKGKVEVLGKVFPMIELNAGIHMDLTGRENVKLLGAIMGLTSDCIKGKMSDIEEFCELGEWFDRPVRMYSSGMLARLGFAVAINVQADVVLIDEVLAVGDTLFQLKCINAFRELINQGTSILLVSHNYRVLKQVCSSGMVIERGRIIEFADIDKAINIYLRLIENKMTRAIPFQGDTNGLRGRNFIINELYVKSNRDQRKNEIIYGEDATVEVEYTILNPVADFYISIGFLTLDGITIATANTIGKLNLNVEPGTYRSRCGIKKIPLLPGTYQLVARIGSAIGYITLNQKVSPDLVHVVERDNRFIMDRAGFVHMDDQWEMPEKMRQFANKERRGRIITRPRILILPDKRGWAFDNIALHFKEILKDRLDIEISYIEDALRIDPLKYDLIFNPNWSYRPEDDKFAGKMIRGIYSQKWEMRQNPVETLNMSLRGAIAVIVPSAILMKKIKPLFNNVFQVPDGVDPKEFFWYRDRGDNNLVVGWTGNPKHEFKGLESIIKPACKKADVELRIASRLSREDLNHFYNDVDIIVIASEFEGGPNQLLEAGACGRTVISTEVGMVPEVIIDGETGFIVERKVEDFLERIVWCKSNLDRVREMGKLHRERILNGWTFEKVAEAFMKVIERVL
jgi:ABC-type polysaccharide/polyol phosphate transport system ATPase subunit/glycosyltransferase involved in cell wall biosynthesis